MKNYDFFASKIMFNLIALFGFLIIFVTGTYWGYTVKENSEYINVTTKEIQLINYINTKYTYNFNHDSNKKYGDEIAPRIFTIVIIGCIIGILLLEIGYRNSNKYKYKKQLKQRIKEFYKKLQKAQK